MLSKLRGSGSTKPAALDLHEKRRARVDQATVRAMSALGLFVAEFQQQLPSGARMRADALLAEIDRLNAATIEARLGSTCDALAAFVEEISRNLASQPRARADAFLAEAGRLSELLSDDPAEGPAAISQTG